MGRGMREERKRKEGKATQPSCDERNPWGGEGVEPWGDRGGNGGRQKGTHGATEGGSWGRQREKKRSRKKRLRIKILLMQILLLVSHRLCWVDGRDEIAWTNQYCDADGEGCNIDEGEEKP